MQIADLFSIFLFVRGSLKLFINLIVTFFLYFLSDSLFFNNLSAMDGLSLLLCRTIENILNYDDWLWTIIFTVSDLDLYKSHGTYISYCYPEHVAQVRRDFEKKDNFRLMTAVDVTKCLEKIKSPISLYMCAPKYFWITILYKYHGYLCE